MAENYFGITDTGKVRSNNEDAFIAQKAVNNQFIVACVIDGVGGYAGGEVAAAIARETILEQVDTSAADLIGSMTEAFYSANERILAGRQQDKQHNSMACVCTLAVVDIQNNQFTYAHIGDTRLYLLRDNSLVKISSDHSFVGFLEDSGRLTEEASMQHPKRNEINKALGFESDIRNQQDYIETGNSPFLPGDVLMLCSDGLTDMVNKADITTILTASGSLKEKGYNLVNLANHNGGHDNVTVVIVKNDKKTSKQEAVMPAATEKKKIEATEPQVTEKNKPEQEQLPYNGKNKSNSGWLAVLSILCLALLASTIWFYMQSRNVQTTRQALPPSDTVVTKSPSAAQQKLLQALSNLKSDTLLLSDTSFKNPVLINTAVNISKDTLYIKAAGNVTFKADSGFNGPAFNFPANCKHAVIFNVVFDGFKTAISGYNGVVQLKNVKFVNCQVPLQSNLTITGNLPVSGHLPADALKADTLSKPTKK